jgi:hypothetical protein
MPSFPTEKVARKLKLSEVGRPSGVGLVSMPMEGPHYFNFKGLPTFVGNALSRRDCRDWRVTSAPRHTT